MARLARIKKEIDMLATDPGPGISAWLLDESNMLQLQGQIAGPTESPYEGGVFLLSIDLPERYPMEPPRVRFMTPIYHPNIDSDGRICLDTLKMAPHGSWSPSVNINTLLLTIRVLMSQPNAEDGLVPEITEEYKRDAALWRKKATEYTKLNAIATESKSSGSSSSASNSNNSSSSAAPQLARPVAVGSGKGPESTAHDTDDSDSDSDSDDGSDDDDEDMDDAAHLSGAKRGRDDASDPQPGSSSSSSSSANKTARPT